MSVETIDDIIYCLDYILRVNEIFDTKRGTITTLYDDESAEWTIPLLNYPVGRDEYEIYRLTYDDYSVLLIERNGKKVLDVKYTREWYNCEVFHNNTTSIVDRLVRQYCSGYNVPLPSDQDGVEARVAKAEYNGE